MSNQTKARRKKAISKPPKQTKQKRTNKLKAGTEQKKPRGKRQCPGCNALVGIRKYQCQHCGYNFPQKPKIVNKDSVFKKSSQKSILTVLEHNIFNTLFKEPAKTLFADFKPSTRAITQNNHTYSNQDITIQVNSQIHKVRYYRPTLINKKYRVFAGKEIMKCVRITEYALVFSEEISVEAHGLTKQDESTVKMYGLQFFHKLGHRYQGESFLYISLTHLEKGFYKTQIKRNIVQIELKSNIAAILCGDGSVQFYTLPSKPEAGEQMITLAEPTKIPTNNGINICWLNGDKTGIIVGDLSGNIKIFTLDQSLSPALTRVYFNAHYNHITSIKCCPLNNESSVLFCSSGYDGRLKIWDYNELDPIYEIDITSKKINSVAWDNGGKFIVIQRDDSCDGCSLLTFFSTLKTVKKQILMSECQQRYIKDYNNYQYLSSSSSSDYCIFGSSQGGVQVCNMQYLRKSSIKKKSHSVTSYPFCGFNIKMEGERIVLREEKMRAQEDTFEPYEHVISDISVVNRNGKDKIAVATYLGLIVIMEKQAEKK